MSTQYVHRPLLRTLLFLLYCGLIQSGSDQALGAPLLQAPIPTLFADAVTATAEMALAPAVIRQRTVQVDLTQWQRNEEAQGATVAGHEQHLMLNFFADATFTVVLQAGETLVNGGSSWVGHVVDAPLSDVVMIVHDDTVNANVYTPQGLFQLRALGNGLHQVRQIDPARLPHSHDDGLLAPPATAEDLVSAAATADNGALVDVMVLYAPTARAAAGGQAAIENLINLAVAQTNQIYANSRITPRLHLVYVGEVNYNTSGSHRFDLERLTGLTDGYMDEIHALRDRYGADLVNLWVEGGDYCGVGWIRAQATSAFSVVARACAENTVTFAHELGHNFGARHDWYVDSYVDTPSYNKGYVNLAQSWLSVMAYYDQCYAAGVNCRPILYFSNPDILYNGVPTGVRAGTSISCGAGNLSNPACDAENYRVHNERALTVANFRPGYTYADLLVEQRDLADPVMAGAEVTYQVTVSNIGAQAAVNVVLTDQLPSGVRFMRATHPGGPCSVSNGVVTCQLGTIAVRSNLLITVVIATDAQTPSRITNLASVSTSAQEERTTNNSASHETLVRSPNGNNIVFISTATNGKLGTLAYSDEDILAYNLFTQRWQLIFDGSDVGITTDVNGFAWRTDGSLLLTFDKPTKVNGVGSVDDSDIVRFVPTKLGATTAGTFSLFLDGSTVELTTNGEDIDAIALTPAGEVVISTLSAAKVGQLSANDADLLVLRNGHWELYFDGSRADLTSTTEDIGGAWIDKQNGEIYLATEGSFIIPGISGKGGDIFLCVPTALGAATSCVYSEFWRKAEGGATNATLDGIEIGTLPAGITITAAGPNDEAEMVADEVVEEVIEEDYAAENSNDSEETILQTVFLPLINR